MDILEFLLEWTTDFIKNKDVFTKNIIKIEKDNDFNLKAIYKDKIVFILAIPSLKDMDYIIKKLEPEKHVILATFCNRANLFVIIKNWKKLVEFKNFTIYFINPFSTKDKKWILCPYVHDRICDESSLELGLKSMFEVVDTITEEEAVSKIKD